MAFQKLSLNSSQNNQFVLEEIDDLDQEPGDEEIREYAEIIGIDLDKEPELLWIARAGITAPLPAEWKPVQMEDGDLYFYNFNTNESSWEHPSDEKYRQMVKEERKNLQLRNSLAKSGRPSSAGKNRAPEPTSNPMLPPSKPPTGGRLVPLLGEGRNRNEKPTALNLLIEIIRIWFGLRPTAEKDTNELPRLNIRDARNSGRLAPLALNSGSTPGQSPARKIKKQEPIGLNFSANLQQPENTTNRPAYEERPKTSRGSTDRQRNSNQPQSSAVTKEPVPLKKGGAKFLKNQNQNKDEHREEGSKSEDSSTDISEQIHIGGANILLEPVGLSSSVRKKEEGSKRTSAIKHEIITNMDSGAEILPKDPSNRENNSTALKNISKLEANNLELEIQKLKAETETEIKKIKERIEREKAAEERKLKTEMDNFLTEEKKRIQKEELELDKIRQEKKETLAKAMVELDEIRKSHSEEKQKLLKENEAELLEIRNQHDSDKKKSVEETKIAEKTTAEDFEAEKSELKEKFEMELRDLEANYESQLLKTRREWKDRIAQEESKHVEELQIRESQTTKATLDNLESELQNLSLLVASLKEETKELIESRKVAKNLEVPLASSTPTKKSKSSFIPAGLIDPETAIVDTQVEKSVSFSGSSSDSVSSSKAAHPVASSSKIQVAADEISRFSKQEPFGLEGKQQKLLNTSTHPVGIFPSSSASGILNVDSFVDDFVDQKWMGFTKGNSILSAARPSWKHFDWSSKYFDYRASTHVENNFEDQLAQLKSWLQDFEKSIKCTPTHKI